MANDIIVSSEPVESETDRTSTLDIRVNPDGSVYLNSDENTTMQEVSAC